MTLPDLAAVATESIASWFGHDDECRDRQFRVNGNICVDLARCSIAAQLLICPVVDLKSFGVYGGLLVREAISGRRRLPCDREQARDACV